MSELALLSGLGYIGSQMPNEKIKVNNNVMSYSDKILLNDNDFSQYNSNTIQNTDEKVKKIYNQRSKDTMNPKKYMIPVYYGLEDKANELGTGTQIINRQTESFSDQFELQKIKPNRKSVGSNDALDYSGQNKQGIKDGWSVFESFDNVKNDSDMTYGVVSAKDSSFTHNNMNIFNRMRDFDTPALRDSRKLEYFSGSSATYTPKKEIEPFFKPVAGNTWGQGGMPSVSTFIENRMQDGVKNEKRKEKPFEPRKIGPGIGLSVNQDSLGGIHDTIRILPKTVDELRRADDQKVSYQPPVIQGKKGDARPVVADFEHRRPDKFKENYMSSNVASGGQIKAQRTADNINIDIGNRTFSTPVIGPASSTFSGITTPKMKGIVQAPKYEQFTEFNQGPAVGNTKISQGYNTYKVADTQRTHTSVTNTGTLGGIKQAITAYDPLSIAQPTKQLPSHNPTGANNSFGYNTYNPSSVAQPTQQLPSHNPTGANNSFGYNTYDPSSVAQPTQQLPSHNPTGANNSFGYNTYNPLSVAQPTQQLPSHNPTGANNSFGYNTYDPLSVAQPTQQLPSHNPTGANNSNQGINYFNSNDLAKQTQQQDLMTKQFQNQLVGNFKTTTQLQDQIKQTQQQDLMSRQFQNQLVGNFKTTTQLQDQIKQTQKQDLMTQQFQNQLVGNFKTTTQLQDQMKQTQQQALMTQQFQNQLVGNFKTTTQLQDEIRQTHQQNLVVNPNMGWMGTHQDSGYIVTDMNAPVTLNQQINYNDHLKGFGNQSTILSNAKDATNWYAPVTLKDQVKNNNYIGASGNPNQTLNQMQYNNANTDAFREVTVASRDPTTSNVNISPDPNSLGYIALKSEMNSARFNPAKQSNFTVNRPELNISQKTMPYYGENINEFQTTTLLNNPYYNNGPNQMYNYVNNPEYKEFINRQPPVIMQKDQLICTNQNHSQ